MIFRKSYDSFKSFNDLLFNMLGGFILLFICTFLLIAPATKKDIKTNAEFVATVTWDENSQDDVDTWLEDPLGNVLYYGHKSVGFMHLDKDDLGWVNDTIIMPDGEEVILRINQEITTIRGFVPGEWTLNVHMFRKTEDMPATVNIRLDKLNPTVVPVFIKTVTLSRHGQEETVARFTMDANGNIIDMNNLYKQLVTVRNIMGNRRR